MMPNDFNLHPRLNFDKLHQRSNSTTLFSEYMEPNSEAGDHKSVLVSSKTTSIDSGSQWRGIQSLLNESSFSSDSSRSTANGGPLSSLLEDTETREKKLCLSLEIQGIGELNTIISTTNVVFANTYRQQKTEFEGIVGEGEIKWKSLDKLSNYLEESKDDAILEIEKESTKFEDTLNQTLSIFRVKENIEEFVRDHEEFYNSCETLLEKLSEDKKRIARVYQILNRSKVSTVPSLENSGERINEVYHKLVDMVDNLPLDENEQKNIKSVIQEVDGNPSFEKKTKCELIIRRLFSIMSNWGQNNKSTAFSTNSGSENWNTVDSFMSGNGDCAAENNNYIINSSSFCLTTDSVSDDSNLNDLEGELRSVTIRRAVEGPNHAFEFDSLNTASCYSGWFSETDCISSYKSVREPMTLSSYEMNSSTGESTFTSISASSMPNQSFENLDEKLETALSVSEPVIPRPPRSVNEKSSIQSATGTRTYSESTDSLNFSSVSLGEMVDEALHTARDVAETQASHLFEVLQNSARKCGVALTDLVTAVSSKSESLSDTQSSHPSNSTIFH